MPNRKAVEYLIKCNPGLELYKSGTGQYLAVHTKLSCSGKYCVIHYPSDHCMKDFPTHWRADRHLMERICPHGIGHPDPDDLAFKKMIYKGTKEEAEKYIYYEEVHGCDGCCHS